MSVTFARGGRQGIALLATLVAMLVIGALVSSILLIALHQQRLGAGSVRRLQAFLAAESGLNTVAESWPSRRYRLIALSSAQSVTRWLADSSSWFRATVHRTGDDAYLIEVEGFNGDSTFRQHLGKFINLVTPAVPLAGAFTAMGPLAMGGDVTISGTPDAGCPGSPTAAGLIVPDSSRVSGSPAIDGAPPRLVDPGFVTRIATELWWVRQDAPVLREADYVLPGGMYSARGLILPYDTCDAPDVTWRTDTTACRAELPVVVVRGDATFAGVISRGLLVVLGDAHIVGSLEFTGLIVVRGRLTSVPDPSVRVDIAGAIIVEDSARRGSNLDGRWTVRFSGCAVRDALANLVIPQPPQHRSWANLY